MNSKKENCTADRKKDLKSPTPNRLLRLHCRRPESLAQKFPKNGEKMDLKRIEEALKKARGCVDEFTWVDPEFSELLLLVADYLLAKETLQFHGVPSSYIPLSAFEKKHKFITANTISRYCKSLDWAILFKNQWWVDEKKTLEFFLAKPIFKKRMQRLREI